MDPRDPFRFIPQDHEDDQTLVMIVASSLRHALPQVLILTGRIRQDIILPLQSSQTTNHSLDQASLTLRLVRTALPPHPASQTSVMDIPDFEICDFGRVVGDHGAGRRVVRE